MNRDLFILAGSVLLAMVFGVVLVHKGWLGGGGPAREVGGIEAPVWLAGALVMQLGSMVGAAVALAALGGRGEGGGEGFARNAAAQGIGYVLAVGLGVVLVRLLRVRASARTGLGVGAGDVGRGAAALVLVAPYYVLAALAASAAVQVWTGAAPDALEHQTLRDLHDRLLTGAADGSERVWAWVTVASAVVGAPVVEELTFRVCLQSFFLRLSGGRRGGWPAVLATSVLFALIHAPVVGWGAVASLFVLSVGLGIAYERTARLGVPIVMHALFNAANVAMVLSGAVG